MCLDGLHPGFRTPRFPYVVMALKSVRGKPKFSTQDVPGFNKMLLSVDSDYHEPTDLAIDLLSKSSLHDTRIGVRSVSAVLCHPASRGGFTRRLRPQHGEDPALFEEVILFGICPDPISLLL